MWSLSARLLNTSVIFGQHLISGVAKQERDWSLAYLVEAQTPKNPCENWKAWQRIVSAFVLLCQSTGMLWETGALSIWAAYQELSLKQIACLQQKPMLAWVQTVRTRQREQTSGNKFGNEAALSGTERKRLGCSFTPAFSWFSACCY